MQIQYKLQNLSWADADDRAEMFIGRVMTRDGLTRDEVLTRLTAGEELQHGDDWYQQIRDADARTPVPEKTADLVRCDCGHECERLHVVSASLGTSCPDCYDRMSG